MNCKSKTQDLVGFSRKETILRDDTRIERTIKIVADHEFFQITRILEATYQTGGNDPADPEPVLIICMECTTTDSGVEICTEIPCP